MSLAQFYFIHTFRNACNILKYINFFAFSTSELTRNDYSVIIYLFSLINK